MSNPDIDGPLPEIKEVEKFQVWGGVTDPTKHNPQEFRYLVHGLNVSSPTMMMGFVLENQLKGHLVLDKDKGDQSINLYMNPEKLVERVSLSMSLIDQDHKGTWGDAGLIVEVPEPNIVITSTSDVGAHNNDLAFLERQSTAHSLMSGNELLRLTSVDSHNEVVAVVKKATSSIRLVGFFYNALSDGTQVNPVTSKQMEMHASRLGLPLVQITQEGLYSGDEIINNEGKLAVHLGGKRYLLKGWQKRNFDTFQATGDVKFPSRVEILDVLEYLRDSKVLNEKELDQIYEEYKGTDLERQRAKIQFDDKGNILGLSKKMGYGNEELELRVGKMGHAYKQNLDKETQEMRESMLGKLTPSFKKQNYLTVSEVRKIVDEVKLLMTDAQKEEIEIWFESILPQVEANAKRNPTYGGQFMEEIMGGKPVIDFLPVEKKDFKASKLQLDPDLFKKISKNK